VIAEARSWPRLLGRPGRFHPERAGSQADLSALLPDNSRRADGVRLLDWAMEPMGCSPRTCCIAG
jgi:hypothetical protein